MASSVREILLKYSTYYSNLSHANRQRFEDRLAELLLYLDFSAEGLDGDVTLEMKIVIASAQIQLTFGLENFIPERFSQITVLPRSYFIDTHPRPVVGHVDPRTSQICFSWRDIKFGFSINDDAINVALHEFAHWLEMESRFASFSNGLLCKYDYSDWRRTANHKLIKIRSQENQFLKDYGGKNMIELFAVSVEAFFEQSQAFKSRLPRLYNTLVELLNQDPTQALAPVLED